MLHAHAAHAAHAHATREGKRFSFSGGSVCSVCSVCRRQLALPAVQDRSPLHEAGAAGPPDGHSARRRQEFVDNLHAAACSFYTPPTHPHMTFVLISRARNVRKSWAEAAVRMLPKGLREAARAAHACSLSPLISRSGRFPLSTDCTGVKAQVCCHRACALARAALAAVNSLSLSLRLHRRRRDRSGRTRVARTAVAAYVGAPGSWLVLRAGGGLGKRDGRSTGPACELMV